MAKPRHKNKPNAKGRNPTSRFARLDHRLLESAAYRSLSPNARSLLVELTMIDNGSNNGKLWLSRSDAAARMGLADEKAAGAAFRELQHMGFIEMTQDAHFKVKASEAPRARCWRLTWLAVPSKKAPTNDYLTREAEPQTRERHRMERGLRALKTYRQIATRIKTAGEDSTFTPHILASIVAGAGEDSTPARLESHTIKPFRIEGDSSSHTAATTGMGPILSTHWWRRGEKQDCALRCITDSKLRAAIMAKSRVAHSNEQAQRISA
jgi:hypothetical protein